MNVDLLIFYSLHKVVFYKENDLELIPRQGEIDRFKRREKVLELSLFACDFFFVLKETGESAWQMGVLI